jgi:6-phosphofructokinase 1
MFVAYLNTFARMGLKAVPMRADTGPIGGDLSHEFIVLADTGESQVFCDKALVEMRAPGPDVDWNDLQAIVDFCRGREQRQRYTIICIGEGAKESGASLTVRERIEQSPDPVRLGGVGHVLRERLQPHLRSEVRTTVLGHVQRGGDPTPFDRVLATQFGHHAAQLVLGGQLGHMVTLQNGRIGSVAIADVANTQRTVPLDSPLLTMARDIGICFGEA